jgi:hypothetical protein
MTDALLALSVYLIQYIITRLLRVPMKQSQACLKQHSVTVNARSATQSWQRARPGSARGTARKWTTASSQPQNGRHAPVRTIKKGKKQVAPKQQKHCSRRGVTTHPPLSATPTPQHHAAVHSQPRPGSPPQRRGGHHRTLRERSPGARFPSWSPPARCRRSPTPPRQGTTAARRCGSRTPSPSRARAGRSRSTTSSSRPCSCKQTLTCLSRAFIFLCLISMHTFLQRLKLRSLG